MCQMNHLETTESLKIQSIVEKLQKLDCTLLGNKDDAWVMELLFKPGFHRYHLVEWILSKFEYDIRKMSGPQNSEERMKNLESTISDLGLCKQNSHDIIKGSAPMAEQLEFWCMLVDILWIKYEITLNLSSLSETDEGVALSPEKSKRKAISEDFDDACVCINEICDSVNMRHLFKHELQILAPDVKRETENLNLSTLGSEMCQIPSLQDLKALAKKNNAILRPKDVYRTVLSQKALSINENQDDSASEHELNQLENEMHQSCIYLQNCAEGPFNDVYDELKPLILHATPEKCMDIGPGFKKVEPLLENLHELTKSLPKLASSNTKLLKIHSELDDFVSHKKLAEPKSISISNLLKEENS